MGTVPYLLGCTRGKACVQRLRVPLLRPRLRRVPGRLSPSQNSKDTPNLLVFPPLIHAPLTPWHTSVSHLRPPPFSPSIVCGLQPDGECRRSDYRSLFLSVRLVYSLLPSADFCAQCSLSPLAPSLSDTPKSSERPRSGAACTRSVAISRMPWTTRENLLPQNTWGTFKIETRNKWGPLACLASTKEQDAVTC